MQRFPLVLPQRVLHKSAYIPGLKIRCFASKLMKRKSEASFDGGAGGKNKSLSLRKSNARSARSISYIQIFGTGMDTGDTSPSVLLFFDSKRFVFNAGEGLQRFCQEHRIKLSKIDHVLLTRVCSETSGGLAGTLLTLAGDIGLTMNIWGPSNLQFLVSAMSTFLPNASVLYTHAFGNDGRLLQEDGNDSSIAVIYEDELVKISAVLLVPENKGKDVKAGDVAVVYVCELPQVKGKFDPKKAAELGIRPGRKYAQLQNGESVFTDDGKKEIFPGDVMEPSSPGPKFVLVDCPTEFHLQPLLAATGLRRFYKQEGGSGVECMVHMGPAGVVNDATYREWMNNFGSTTHILAGSGCSQKVSPILKSSAKILTKLHFACPYIFPVRAPAEVKESGMHEEASTVVAARNLLKFRLLPLSGLGMDESAIPEEFNAKTCEADMMEELPELLPEVEKMKELWSGYRPRNNNNNEDLVEEPFLSGDLELNNPSTSSPTLNDVPEALKSLRRGQAELIFLGTGSSHPSTYRNVSAIYLHCFRNGGMLLDCGEGTYGQLIRRFGRSEAEAVVEGLRCVWISHIHADHHAGLARILSVRRELLARSCSGETLLVVGPKPLKPVLEAYDKLEDLSVEFLDCSQTTPEAEAGPGFIGAAIQKQSSWLHRGFHLREGPDEAGRIKLGAALEGLGIRSLISVPVMHCPYAFGVVIQAQGTPGWKLAYSGDTRPCRAFIDASRGATAFIHEATFEDGMVEEAISKMHSSTQEAIRAGVEAEAYRIILTHFSQRYSKVPVFDESYNDRTFVAFDLMSIDFVDLPLLPTLVPVLKLLFKDEQPELEQELEDEAVENNA